MLLVSRGQPRPVELGPKGWPRATMVAVINEHTE